MQKTSTFLMFVGEQSGKAEEAINVYISLFKNSGIKKIDYYGANEPGGKEGDVKHAIFTIDGQEYMASDGGTMHQFSFTPAISIFVDCTDEKEMDELFNAFSAGGSVMMPPDNYGFSRKFCWVADKYGVSWQLNVQ